MYRMIGRVMHMGRVVFYALQTEEEAAKRLASVSETKELAYLGCIRGVAISWDSLTGKEGFKMRDLPSVSPMDINTLVWGMTPNTFNQLSKLKSGVEADEGMHKLITRADPPNADNVAARLKEMADNGRALRAKRLGTLEYPVDNRGGKSLGDVEAFLVVQTDPLCGKSRYVVVGTQLRVDGANIYSAKTHESGTIYGKLPIIEGSSSGAQYASADSLRSGDLYGTPLKLVGAYTNYEARETKIYDLGVEKGVERPLMLLLDAYRDSGMYKPLELMGLIRIGTRGTVKTEYINGKKTLSETGKPVGYAFKNRGRTFTFLNTKFEGYGAITNIVKTYIPEELTLILSNAHIDDPLVSVTKAVLNRGELKDIQCAIEAGNGYLRLKPEFAGMYDDILQLGEKRLLENERPADAHEVRARAVGTGIMGMFSRDK